MPVEPWKDAWLREREFVGRAMHGAWRDFYASLYTDHPFQVERSYYVDATAVCGKAGCGLGITRHIPTMVAWEDVSPWAKEQYMREGVEAFRRGFEAALK